MATKLRWEMTNLERARSEQLIMLAQLALQHEPEGIDIGAEASELQALQRQLEEKELTANALSGTSGAGPALNQIKQEIAELQGRQRALMCQIGAKAYAARPDMPQAEAHYRAVEQLEGAIEVKRAALGELGSERAPAEFGRVRPSVRISISSFVKPLICLAAVVAVIAGAFYAYDRVSGYLAARLPAYVPSDVQTIQSVQFGKMSASLDQEYLKSAVDKPVELAMAMDELRMVTYFRWDNSKDAMVLQTLYPVSLEEMPLLSEQAREKKRYRGYSYITVPAAVPVMPGMSRPIAGYLAQLEKKLYCFARKEEQLKEILAFYDRGRRPELSAAIKLAYSYVRGWPYHAVTEGRDFRLHSSLRSLVSVARVVNRLMRIKESAIAHIRAVGLGAEMDDENMSCVICYVLSRERYAQRLLEDLPDLFDGLEDYISARLSEDKAIDIVEPLRDAGLKQRGRSVVIRVTWPHDAIDENLPE